MPRTANPTRVFIVALLVMSTAMAAICTPLLAQTLRSSTPMAKRAAITCCCGGDGSCCGMACCLRRASNQVPNPPVRSGVEQVKSPVQSLYVSACESDSNSVGNLSGVAHSERNASPGMLTLQSQHIRIQT
jgi:hypothetical protein